VASLRSASFYRSTSAEPAPMPPEKSLGTHHEGSPGRAGEGSAGRSKHHAVESAKARPARLTPEDSQLMTQDEDLDVPLLALGVGGSGETEQPTQDEVKQENTMGATPL
jgi:hypothetical protein